MIRVSHEKIVNFSLEISSLVIINQTYGIIFRFANEYKDIVEIFSQLLILITEDKFMFSKSLIHKNSKKAYNFINQIFGNHQIKFNKYKNQKKILSCKAPKMATQIQLRSEKCFQWGTPMRTIYTNASNLMHHTNDNELPAQYASHLQVLKNQRQVYLLLDLKQLSKNKQMRQIISDQIDQKILKGSLQLYLTSIVRQIEQQDAGYLKQNIRYIIEKTKKLFISSQTWKLNRETYAPQLSHLMRVLVTQIQIYSDFKVIFCEWEPFKKLFMEKTNTWKINKLEHNPKYKENELTREAKRRNQILKDYQSKYKYVDPIMMTKEGPQSISKFISVHFPKTRGWKEIFSALQRDLRIQDEQIYFMKQIHEERPMQRDHLCCSQFLYQGMDCYNRQIDCLYEVDYIDDSQKGSQMEIKQKFISFINSKGGILLFDVYPNLSELIVEGKVLNEQQKQQIQSKINSYFQSISPRVKIKENYKYRWVPIIQNPTRYLSEPKAQGEQYRERRLKPGRWLLMIIITPATPQVTYHYTANSNNYIIKRTKDQNKKQLQAKESYSFIKNRFMTYYGKKGFQHAHDIYPLFDPLKGRQIYGEEKGIEQIRKQNTNKGKDYKFHSLIIVDRTNRQKVQNVLNKQKIDFLIEQAFPEYALRLASTTWILHHNAKFDKVKIEINKNNLRYANNSKTVILISTTKTLQTSFIDQGGIQNLRAWIKGIFPSQQITFQKKDNECYLSTQTIMGCIFMYMLLDNFQIRARFKKVPSEQSKIPNPGKRSNL